MKKIRIFLREKVLVAFIMLVALMVVIFVASFLQTNRDVERRNIEVVKYIAFHPEEVIYGVSQKGCHFARFIKIDVNDIKKPITVKNMIAWYEELDDIKKNIVNPYYSSKYLFYTQESPHGFVHKNCAIKMFN